MTILYILLGLSLLAVVVTLLMGGKAMVGGDTDRSNSNKWMWRRVWAQGIALLLLVLIVYTKSKSG